MTPCSLVRNRNRSCYSAASYCGLIVRYCYGNWIEEGERLYEIQSSSREICRGNGQPLGRFRRSWQCNIETYLRAVVRKNVGWIVLVQDTVNGGLL